MYLLWLEARVKHKHWLTGLGQVGWLVTGPFYPSLAQVISVHFLYEAKYERLPTEGTGLIFYGMNLTQ